MSLYMGFAALHLHPPSLWAWCPLQTSLIDFSTTTKHHEVEARRRANPCTPRGCCKFVIMQLRIAGYDSNHAIINGRDYFCNEKRQLAQ